MGRPFWTAGPVPSSLLGDLALPRPAAQAAALARLAAGDPAWIGGARGTGRSTFLGQVLQAAGRRALVLDVEALLQGGEDEALVAAGREAGLRVAPTWDLVLAVVGPRPALAIDGVGDLHRPWVQPLAGRLAAQGVAVLVASDGEGIALDPIGSPAASAFLEARTSRVRMAWTGAALREAVALAAGHPARLQAVGAACLHASLEAGRRRIAMEDFLEAALEVAQARPGQGPLAGMDGPRLALLKAVVRDPGASPTEWAQRCALEPRAAVVHLGRLVAGGWLARPARGRYAVADPAIALHLQGRFATMARIVAPTPNPALSRP